MIHNEFSFVQGDDVTLDAYVKPLKNISRVHSQPLDIYVMSSTN